MCAVPWISRIFTGGESVVKVKTKFAASDPADRRSRGRHLRCEHGHGAGLVASEVDVWVQGERRRSTTHGRGYAHRLSDS
jgi:hypothetical protein